MKNHLSFLAIVLLSALSSTAVAHHSSAPHFDHDNPITVEGVFKEIRFVNPHAYIYFSSSESGQSEDWRCELSSATQLGRWGWSADMFSIGQKLTITGSPARREDNVCYMNSIELADGTEISRNSDLTTMQDVMVANASTKQERAKFLANGHSNIEGAWITRSFGRGGEGIRAQFTATEAGESAVGSYDMAFDDPILRCHPVNIFNGWNHDRHVNEIKVGEDQITLQYGFMDFVRTVYMAMSEHSENVVPSTGGHSIGKWEGDTLVVDTTGFESGILNHQSGMKHSDQMHTIERFRVDSETGYLVRDYYVTDPLYLVGEVHGQDLMAPSEVGYSPYNCVELSGDNNIRQEDQQQK